MLIEGAHPLRQLEQPAKASFQRRIVINRAADAADGTAQSRPQEIELAPGTFELRAARSRDRSNPSRLISPALNRLPPSIVSGSEASRK